MGGGEGLAFDDAFFRLTGIIFLVYNSDMQRSPFNSHVALRNDRNSINSQKLSDERHAPFMTHDAFRYEMRHRQNFVPSAALSSLAGKEGGNAQSFRAVRYYQKNFAERRDEILTDIAKNG